MVEDLISVRNLTDSDFGTPLREFKGKLDSYYPEDEKFGMTVKLNFKDIEVITAVEPYHFPTAILSIKLSNKKRSGWGILGDSLAIHLGPDEDIKDAVGREWHMKMKEGHIYGQDRKTGEDMIGNPWQVVALDGASGAVVLQAAADVAKGFLIGRTRAEFNKKAYGDPIIRKDTELQRAITNKSFIAALLTAGEIIEDENGVFQLPTDMPFSDSAEKKE